MDVVYICRGRRAIGIAQLLAQHEDAMIALLRDLVRLGADAEHHQLAGGQASLERGLAVDRAFDRLPGIHVRRRTHRLDGEQRT